MADARSDELEAAPSGGREGTARRRDGSGGPAVPGASLAATVDALRREIDGLRASAAMRAVIEQAKGVLVERHGISLDEAFERLRKISAQHNVRLVEVAATLVGIRLPDQSADLDLRDPVPAPGLGTTSAMSREWRSLREQPDVKARAAGALFHAVSSSVTEGGEAARLIRDLLAGQVSVSAVVLYRLAGDGSLHLVGSEGYPGDLVTAWAHIPPVVDIPLARAARTRRAFFMRNPAERNREFPTMKGVMRTFEASAALPVLDAGEVIGAVGMGWNEPQDFTAEQRAQIGHLVRTAAPVLLRSVYKVDAELTWMATVLELLFDPWLVLAPADGGAPGGDLEVTLAAPSLPGAAGLQGRLLLELWPDLTEGPLPAALTRVLTRGVTWDDELSAEQLGGLPGAGARTRVRVVRAGPRVVIHWRHRED